MLIHCLVPDTPVALVGYHCLEQEDIADLVEEYTGTTRAPTQPSQFLHGDLSVSLC
jgi:hypothetical protein